MDLGSYVQHEGRPAVRFQRTYAHPIERVWDAVAKPEGLAHWFPSTVEIESRVGGTIVFSGDPSIDSMTTGTVLVFDPPEHLAFSWANEELHFDLERLGDTGCRFTFVHVLEATDAAARTAAGWSVCLGEFDKHLAGAEVDGPHSDTAEPWQPYYDAYVVAGMPSGAPIPGVPSEAADRATERR